MHEINSRLVAIMFVQVTESGEKITELPVASCRLEEYRKELSEHIKSFSGVYLEINSGEIYACFIGAVSAFNAALCLQSILPQYNLRIGLHLGEVLCRQGKFKGREVNLASRLPTFARAGGICLSQSVHQYLEDKDKKILVALGVHNLKHVNVGVPLFAYLPAGQATRCRWRELKRNFIKKLWKYKWSVWALYLIAIGVLFSFPHLVGYSTTDRKILKVFVAEFDLRSHQQKKSKLLQSIELSVRSMLSGRHGALNIHLLNQRSSAQIELLVSIEQIANRLQTGYVINSLPQGNTLAYGGFGEDESRVFHLQDRLAEQILAALPE
jgi:hypothetical protein